MQFAQGGEVQHFVEAAVNGAGCKSIEAAGRCGEEEGKQYCLELELSTLYELPDCLENAIGSDRKPHLLVRTGINFGAQQHFPYTHLPWRYFEVK